MDNKNQPVLSQKKITRKEALQKGGKYAAFTAATMMMILGPSKEAAAESVTSSSSPERAPDRFNR